MRGPSRTPERRNGSRGDMPRGRRARPRTGKRVRVALLLGAVLGLGAGAYAWAGSAATQDPLGKSTVEQRIVPNDDAGFRELAPTTGEPYIVREDGVGTALSGRQQTRSSVLYFGQVSDFQLADEESPSRVEFTEAGPTNAAWRPWEAMEPQIDDAMIRQINSFKAASPIAAGDASHAAMDMAIDTGDSADSMQRNETEWVRALLEGGALNPGSGVNPASVGDPICTALGALNLIADGSDPSKYTGVQDFDDYVEGVSPGYYDPDSPSGAFTGWPKYPNLMDSAQKPFDAAGLGVPSYVTFGNHDALVQGNAAANAAYEKVATGCIKPMSPASGDPGTLQGAFTNTLTSVAGLNLAGVQSLLGSDPTKIAAVPPDPNRQYVSKKQYKQIFLDGTQADGHGFAYIDPAVEAASSGAAGYYAWNPKPDVRFISLDTISEAGVIGPSADGNIDDPQFQWLKGQLDDAAANDQYVVLFSHHAIPSLTADIPDEVAPPCTVADPHGHDTNPGCDLDPRDSTPIHLGADMNSLLLAHPNVIAWVAGHSHVNSIEPHPAPGGGGFWSIRVAAEADWPQQGRLLEIFNNHDGTISIFGTIIDHASAATAPASDSDAATMSISDLASVGRTLSYNDTQTGARACDPDPCGEGKANDRNVELMVKNPIPDDEVVPPPGGKRCADHVQNGTGGPDRLTGTASRDKLLGLGGADVLIGKAAADCLRGGNGGDRLYGWAGNDFGDGGLGNDLLRGGHGNDRLRPRRGNDRVTGGAGRDLIRGGRGRDRIYGGAGQDRIWGGQGPDRIRGGRGNDRIRTVDSARDRINCGAGKHDRAIVDTNDIVAANCESVRVRRIR